MLMMVWVDASMGVRYYAQCIFGHFDILYKTVPIVKLLARADTPPKVKRRLTMVLNLRQFASDELGLPANNSYQSYADVGRRYVVWNVVATQELSLAPASWCYPVAGCFKYRGYFSEDDAHAYAQQLRERGRDVFVRGVTGYSTLGWFGDPLLNTMLALNDVQLVKLILHELAHQKLHIRDDTAFNEAFANVVAREGSMRWATEAGSSFSTFDIQATELRDKDFAALILRTRGKLEALYTSPDSDSEKRAQKTAIFAELEDEYRAWKERWNGYAVYDDWVLNDMNNAKIAFMVTYHELEHAFEVILKHVNGDLINFYKIVAALGNLRPRARADCLKSINESADGPIPVCLNRRRMFVSYTDVKSEDPVDAMEWTANARPLQYSRGTPGTKV